MKRSPVILLALLLLLIAPMALIASGEDKGANSPDSRFFTNNPEGADIQIEKIDHDVPIQKGSTYTVTFPDNMVAANRIDLPASIQPIDIWPHTETTFVWRSPTQGELTIKGAIIPDQHYRLRLRKDLKNLAGTLLPDRAWGVDLLSPAFKVSRSYGSEDSIETRPTERIEFNYPVRMDDATANIWFQDRLSREKFPVELILSPIRDGDKTIKNAKEKQSLTEIRNFQVNPIQDLPANRNFDLVVDNVRDETGGKPMQYLRVFRLGRTSYNSVKYVAARNNPVEKPYLEVKFEQRLGDNPVPKDALIITPEVSNIRYRVEGPILIAEGDFDPTLRYTVKISDKILAWSGYGLEKPETWAATFHPKTPAIIFPDHKIRQCSDLGLNFAFYHANTSALEWKLAPIPVDKLPKALEKEQDFTKILKGKDQQPLWDEEGCFKRAPSHPLIPEMGLEVIASGSVPSAGEEEVLRKISWKPAQGRMPSGPMLLEVTGTDAKGQVIGNRAIIYFGEKVITRKETAAMTILRIAKMSDGLPQKSLQVEILDNNLKVIAQATTDGDGMVSFDKISIPNAEYYRAGETLQPVSFSDSFWSGSINAQALPALRAYTFTDRPLYRPGQSVQFKGIVRMQQEMGLKIPEGAPVKWTIEREFGREVFASRETKVDENGAWNASWTPPQTGALGPFCVRSLIYGKSAGDPAQFRVEEFRNPLFSVICEEAKPAKPADSSITVQSQYFHGAPNNGAKVHWTATWYNSDLYGSYADESNMDDPMTRVDRYSEHHRVPVGMAEISGDARLNSHGSVDLECLAPFRDLENRARCTVSWKVDITGPEGQTITGGTVQQVFMAPSLLGIAVVEQGGGNKFLIKWDDKAPFGKGIGAVNASFYLVESKSVKERLGNDIYRYRNFDSYQLVEQRTDVVDRNLEFSSSKPGRYVVVLSPVKGFSGFPVSQSFYVSGDQSAQMPVESDNTLKVVTSGAKISESESRIWKVGETASLDVLAPTGGVAWVCVETDHILDSFVQPLEGNVSQIKIPIKPEYEPGVYVSVYLLRPGHEKELAGEMFGFGKLKVEAPDRRLEIKITTTKPEYMPHEMILGHIKVTAAGGPVIGANLALYAVDDSILHLGDWMLPNPVGSFFPTPPYGVVTYSGLKDYLDKISPDMLTMKGFVVGDGGDESPGKVVLTRKEFKPLILWNPNVTTDSSGEAQFSCEASDNLTRFRIIAVGQTKENQFGAGDTTLTVTKHLFIDPALPRFVRQGDTVELRAVVRQDVLSQDKLTVRCAVEGGLELLGESSQEISVEKNGPVIVRFKAQAKKIGQGKVHFEVASSQQPLKDLVENDLPIAEPVITIKESIAGSIQGSSLSLSNSVPADWKSRLGTFNVAVSSTPWLTKIMGLPSILEYPHGCLEQKSTRILGYTYLGRLLDYLPFAEARRSNYEQIVSEILGEFESSLLPDGRLPYWPGGTEPNDFVTIQACWCVAQAKASGFTVPERLFNELHGSLKSIVNGKLQVNPTLRAFALFAMTATDSGDRREIADACDNLYLMRDKMDPDGRAMLAITLNRLGLAPEKQRRLLDELPPNIVNDTFNPHTFSSMSRTRALCTWARLMIDPGMQALSLEKRLSLLMESSSSLSTQENLWLLIAFNSLLEAKNSHPLTTITPQPGFFSSNRTAAAWNDLALNVINDFVASETLPGGSFVVQSAYRPSNITTPLVSHGMRVERVIKDLTNPDRTGEETAPFKLGDQLFISYRFSTQKPQNYVSLEDLLPAGVEVINPNLPLVAKLFELPQSYMSSQAVLSHSEMRDQQTNLYFDDLPAGKTTYGVLARATAAGHFIWPAAQIMPMYDSRFYGRSPSRTCTVSAD